MWGLENFPTSRLVWENILHEVVAVTHGHPQQVHGDGVAEDEGEAEQDPGQVGGVEGEEAEEVHPDVRIPPGPDVDQHYREGLEEKTGQTRPE